VTESTSPFEPDAGGPPPDPGAGQPVDQPDLRKMGEALRDQIEIRSLAITGLFVLALFYTLYFARAFFLPIVLAMLLDFLLSPLIRTLKRARIPEPLGAALVLVGLLAGTGGAVYGLAGPAREWASRLPAGGSGGCRAHSSPCRSSPRSRSSAITSRRWRQLVNFLVDKTKNNHENTKENENTKLRVFLPCLRSCFVLP
jgi:predicted PurR-regulated permease PerM